jgi:hypothetical protein
MRLSEVLSKPPTLEFKQVEGFLGNKTLAVGKQMKIVAGKVGINFFCRTCSDSRTFYSGEELYCIGVNKSLVSIDCVITCQSCGSSVQLWFLIDCDGNINDRAPQVRILKRSEKLSNTVVIDKERYGDFSELLEKAQRARRDGLGAGAMVYLRKIFEQITQQMATAAGIPDTNTNGKRKTFKALLEEVDRQRSIIPREFSENGYRLFGELSDIIHSEYNEELALRKYESLHRLVVGILDNVRNNNELITAIGTLGWNTQNGGHHNE